MEIKNEEVTVLKNKLEKTKIDKEKEIKKLVDQIQKESKIHNEMYSNYTILNNESKEKEEQQLK